MIFCGLFVSASHRPRVDTISTHTSVIIQKHVLNKKLSQEIQNQQQKMLGLNIK